ncbi:MAG TPA: hypothetical protein VGG07_25115 [Solirubrobacteraceae bacterium]|jgi:hypothetical protein
MAHPGYALTVHTAVMVAALEGAARHLDQLAKAGQWDVHCDRVADRLGRYGMGRN